MARRPMPLSNCKIRRRHRKQKHTNSVSGSPGGPPFSIPLLHSTFDPSYSRKAYYGDALMVSMTIVSALWSLIRLSSLFPRFGRPNQQAPRLHSMPQKSGAAKTKAWIPSEALQTTIAALNVSTLVSLLGLTTHRLLCFIR